MIVKKIIEIDGNRLIVHGCDEHGLKGGHWACAYCCEMRKSVIKVLGLRIL